ncbi:hypothetical protein KR52_11795 [Synechococcus sp. KORDI-52]|uniref:ATP-binding protein n=1 Tax=Synechococcus sp. KORDI-52 TaxID=585425 RepID=UPI0004E09C3F|nr:ATP-binding protein [Synechococcus sp. KORDI-52]AII49815.1 hypothetical protein KR52_11795 [Synechococcus sp. KORDI-52]
MLIGPPGSGKSTLAATLAESLRAPVVSSDNLRQELWGDAGIQGPWSELEPRLHGAIDNALAAAGTVIMDATHAQLSWRQRLMQRHQEARRVQWIGWWLQTPLHQCLAWNRSRHRHVPEPIIRAMHKRLTTPPDQPDPSEGFTSLIRLNPCGACLNKQVNRALQIIHSHEER